MRCPYCSSKGPFLKMKKCKVKCKKCGYKFDETEDLEIQDPYRKYPEDT
jgi:transposase-like protein